MTLAVQRRHTLRFPAQPHLRLDPGCVVSYCPVASSLGARVLYGGGNAVDAAVATALALAVTYPQAGNLGGGGFMMVHAGGEVHALDYRETAPARATPGLYDDEGSDTAKSALGPLAVGVPGTIAGLAEAHARFGRRPWAELVNLVVPLAEEGSWLTARQASSLRIYNDLLRRYESTTRYFTDGGNPLLPGTLFKQPDLGRTLRAIASGGPQAFYQGAIADLIVAQVAGLGGVLDHEDLAAYRATWRAPLHRVYQNHDVYLPSLPSAGGLVTGLALGGAEALEVESLRYGSAAWVSTWARIFRVAFAAGNRLAGDPGHISPREITEAHELAERAMSRESFERVEAEFRVPGALVGDAAAAVRRSTTHFSILDRDGMAVSNTYSVNTLFGSKLAVAGAGFLLNNTMADFRISDGPNWYGLLQGERNRLAPARRPASSMTPTLVLKDGQTVMVLGASGGPRIPTAVAQVTATVLGSGLSLSESVRRPRVHHQLFPDDLVLEKGFRKATIDRLIRAGHPVSLVSAGSTVAAIRRKLEDDEISAVLDQRFGDFW